MKLTNGKHLQPSATAQRRGWRSPVKSWNILIYSATNCFFSNLFEKGQCNFCKRNPAIQTLRGLLSGQCAHRDDLVDKVYLDFSKPITGGFIRKQISSRVKKKRPLLGYMLWKLTTSIFHFPSFRQRDTSKVMSGGVLLSLGKTEIAIRRKKDDGKLFSLRMSGYLKKL